MNENFSNGLKSNSNSNESNGFSHIKYKIANLDALRLIFVIIGSIFIVAGAVYMSMASSDFAAYCPLFVSFALGFLALKIKKTMASESIALFIGLAILANFSVLWNVNNVNSANYLTIYVYVYLYLGLDKHSTCDTSYKFLFY